VIRALVDFALNNKFVVMAIAVLLLAWGAVSFHNLPVEAYPEISDNYVTVITQWPGRAAEEVEQQVTIPIEIQMNGIPHLWHLRSESIFGLSFVIMIFDDSSVNDWNRQKVLERLSQVSLPEGLQPQMGTDWGLVGQIYWYTLRSTNPKYDLMELRSIEDWVLLKEFKSVPNVVDVSDFGGTVREYQVRVDPNKLVSYGLNIGQVEQQLASNNINAGGSFVEVGMQQMNVRALGLFSSVQDIEQTVLKTQTGTALRVKDVAEVTQGPKIRLGHMARANHMEDGRIIDEPDVIQGIVLLRKGAEEQPTLKAIHRKVDELNNGILPPGVKVVPCAQIGGETYIGSLHRMFPHIPLIASGGVNQQNASKFILAGAIALGVGRELIPPDAIRRRQQDRIGELARRFLGFVKLGRDHLAARAARRTALGEE
jgi:cobalt-zinc-cadmium resistance protein CzcA